MRAAEPVANPDMAASRANPAETAVYLLLDIAGTACALPRAAVSEVLPVPDLFQPPATGGTLAGFLNLGGEPVPVIDLARLLGLRSREGEPGLYAHIVLAADRRTGFLADRASDLVTVAAEAVRSVAASQSLNGCVSAEIALQDALVHALSPERILTAEERERLEALTRAARARLADLPAV